MNKTKQTRLFGILTTFAGVLLTAVSIVMGMLIDHGDNSLVRFCFSDYRTAPFVLFGTVTILVGLFILCPPAIVQRCCGLLTTLDAFGLSMFGAMGFLCYVNLAAIAAFGKRSSYPHVYPWSLTLGAVALVAVAVLAALYIYLRKKMKEKSALGILFDVLFALLYFVPFLSAGVAAMNILSKLV